MRVGIVGDKERASAWEKHLRPLAAVNEVIITSDLSEVEDVQACILLDDSRDNLHTLSESIRLGIHTYLISELPTDNKRLKLIHSLSQESDVRVQFSHWPTLSPASQWMKQKLPKPGFIEVLKEQPTLSFTENHSRFSQNWMSEIGWIIKWMDMGTHRIEAQSMIPEYPEAGIRIYIKFENGASASLFFLTAGINERHRRIGAGTGLLLDNCVNQQVVKKTQINNLQKHSVSSHQFDTTKSAELSALLFFKAIKMKSSTAFTPYDALQISSALEKISGILKLP